VTDWARVEIPVTYMVRNDVTDVCYNDVISLFVNKQFLRICRFHNFYWRVLCWYFIF